MTILPPSLVSITLLYKANLFTQNYMNIQIRVQRQITFLKSAEII